MLEAKERFIWSDGRSFFYVHFQKEEIHMELNEEEKRQLFQVDGDCQAKAPAKQKWQFSLARCAIDIL